MTGVRKSDKVKWLLRGSKFMEPVGPQQGIRFSTDTLPERDRLPYLREVIGRSIIGMDLEPFQGRPLRWAASRHPFDGLLAISARTDGIVSRRTRPLLADGNDDFLLMINLSGVCLASQVRRECRLDAGSAVLLSGADVGGLVRPRPTRFLTLLVPRRRLLATAVKPEDALARPIPADTEALRLLVDYVETALRKRRLTSPELRQLFTTHVHDLIALAVGATREAGEAARGRGLRAARLSAIKGDIMGRLDNEGLCVADAAVRRGVTPRYVQMLFESEGTTFTQYVLEQRLTRALRMLGDPRHQDWTISAIAFEVGFGNLSYFNRTFRRHFGMTPSDARSANR
jgi:AraC-like DNA-binding protein